MDNTIKMSAQMLDDTLADVKYYSISKENMGKDLCFNLCIGDLYKIANVLYDYEGILREMSNLFPEEYSGGSSMINEVYADQLRKIRTKIEKELEYSVEEAIVKCEKKKKNPKKSDDIGEDAFTLAVKRTAENAKEKKEKMVEESKNKKKKKDNQMTLEQMGVFAK